jgi:hypothetical protein
MATNQVANEDSEDEAEVQELYELSTMVSTIDRMYASFLTLEFGMKIWLN